MCCVMCVCVCVGGGGGKLIKVQFRAGLGQQFLGKTKLEGGGMIFSQNISSN